MKVPLQRDVLEQNLMDQNLSNRSSRSAPSTALPPKKAGEEDFARPFHEPCEPGAAKAQQQPNINRMHQNLIPIQNTPLIPPATDYDNFTDPKVTAGNRLPLRSVPGTPPPVDTKDY